MKCADLRDVISTAAGSDSLLAALYSRAGEYMQVYLFAKKRQKGCDGLGEMTNLKDELRGVLEEMIAYCRERELLARTMVCDVDRMIEDAEGEWLI